MGGYVNPLQPTWNRIIEAEDWLNTSAVKATLPQTLAVGWSGGLDSTALLLCLHQQGFHVQAWHIDHAWHSHSAQDAHILGQQAQLWGIPFFSKRLHQASQTNREAEARKGRYESFQALALQTGIHDLALAHHADDQAETVCMRMLQGAGVMGMQGMRHQSYSYGLSIYRPFLHVRRSNLQQALQASGIAWLEDASNTDVRLWRNKIRLNLLPAMQACGVDAQQLWMRWQQQASRLSNIIEQGLEGMSIHMEEGGCWVHYPAWDDLPQPMRVQMIQRMAATVLGAGKVLGRRHMTLIECWRQKGARAGLDLSGCRLSRQGEGLHLKVRAAISRP